MTDFFSIAPKKRKKLQKFFAWFSVLSLVLQIGSGALFARPSFAQEATPTPTPTKIVKPTPTPETEEILGEGVGGGTMDWEEGGLLPKKEVEGEEKAEEGQILGGVSAEAPQEGIVSQIIKGNRLLWGLGLLVLVVFAYLFYRRRD